MALAIGAASLPDVDLLLGYVANGDLFSLHHEVITHKPAFAFLVGTGAGLAAAGRALLSGHRPRASEVLRPAALATALVASHIAMDPLPLPYDNSVMRTAGTWGLVVSQAWNAVIDMAFYGTLAVLALERNGEGRRADAPVPRGS